MLRTILTLFAVAGLIYAGNTPSATSPPDTRSPVTLRTVKKDNAQSVREDVYPILAQPGPPAPFDPARPLYVRVPVGYDGIPPNDYYLQPNGAGLWLSGGQRGFSLAAIQSITATGPVTSLALAYDYPGYHTTANGQLEPLAFSDQHRIAADGSWRPFEPATRVPGWSLRFPGATGPFVVFQP